MNPLIRVGLTGGIGSGKSTAKKYFDELNVPTVDADEISHRITRPGQPAFNEVVDLFGKESLDKSGYLNRQRLRELIFSIPEMKKKLEAIVHPRVREEIQAFISQVTYPYCVICIPLLLETGTQDTVDRILVIDAPQELQLVRVTRRDKTNENQTRSILKAQTSRTDKLRAAHDIIINDGSISDLKIRVRNLHDKYLELSRQQNKP